MSQDQKKEVTFQEYYINMRNQVTLSSENLKENALRALDDLANKFADSMKQVEALQGALKKSGDEENKTAEKTAEKKSKKD